jgi:hypothetical protein
MLEREIWKFIHPRVSYSLRAYFLYPHAINVLLYRMNPRKHIYWYVKYCWQTYFKSIGTLSQIFKNHIVTVAFKWCVPSAFDVFLSKNDNSGGKTRESSEVVNLIILRTLSALSLVNVMKTINKTSKSPHAFAMCSIRTDLLKQENEKIDSL